MEQKAELEPDGLHTSVTGRLQRVHDKQGRGPNLGLGSVFKPTTIIIHNEMHAWKEYRQQLNKHLCYDT